MSKTVYGAYDSNAELIQAVNMLKAKGYKGDDLTVVAKNEEALDFTNDNRTTDVETFVTENDDSIAQKLVRFFVDDNRDTLEGRLIHAGLSEKEADAYSADVKAGRVLLVVDAAGSPEGSADTRASQLTGSPLTGSDGQFSDREEAPEMAAEPGSRAADSLLEGELQRSRYADTGSARDMTGTAGAPEQAGTDADYEIATGAAVNPDPNIFPETTARTLPVREGQTETERREEDASGDLVGSTEELNQEGHAAKKRNTYAVEGDYPADEENLRGRL